MNTNTIHVSKLRLQTHIGVPAAERENAQTLLLSLAMTPRATFEEMRDDVAQTIDYAVVCVRAQALAADRPRQLVETLAADLAAMILAEFPCSRVEVELQKFILPETEFVGVRLVRQRS